MSLPLGHATAGLTVAVIFANRDEFSLKKYSYYVWAVILSGLPDIDFFLYLIVPDRHLAFIYRHTVTHSIPFFIVITPMLIWVLPWKPRWRCAMIAFSILTLHSVMDCLYRDTPVTFLWPFSNAMVNYELLPDIKIMGDMNVLIQPYTLFHTIVEGVIGLIIFILVVKLKWRALSHDQTAFS